MQTYSDQFWVRLWFTICGQGTDVTKGHFDRWRDVFHYRLFVGGWAIIAVGVPAIVWKAFQ